jgi:hypothetical protein
LTITPLAEHLFVFSRLNSCSGLVSPLPDACDENDFDEDALGVVFGRIESVAVFFKSRKRGAAEVSKIWSYKKKYGLS